MGVKKLKSITYRGMSDLPMYNYIEIRKSFNYNWLIVGYDGYLELTPPDNGEKLFETILSDYCELIGDNKSLHYYELKVDVARLKTRYTIAKSLLLGLTSYCNKETLKEIKQELSYWDFIYDDGKTLGSELQRLGRQLRSAITTIERKSREVEEFEKKNESNSTFLDEKLQIERVLGINRIDLKVTPVEEYGTMVNAAKKVK